VPQEKVERILQAVHLAPTSSGLQPFEVIVVTNAPLREKIQAIANGQTQIGDGSHLLVFAAWDDYTAERINAVFDHTNAERGGKNEGWEAYRQMLLARYPQRAPKSTFSMPRARPTSAWAWRWSRRRSKKWTARPWKASMPTRSTPC